MICIICNLENPDENFHFRKDSQTYRTSCRRCENQRKAKYTNKRGDTATYARTRLLKLKHMRKDPQYRARFILEDTRRTDRKQKLENDLTREFVQALIDKGCLYCGATQKMTLDRIDNQLGHIKQNIVPACYRCNMLRRNMPYKAWINIVPAIRDTFEKGLFDEWDEVGVWRT